MDSLRHLLLAMSAYQELKPDKKSLVVERKNIDLQKKKGLTINIFSSQSRIK
jgi:hypothetical protein